MKKFATAVRLTVGYAFATITVALWLGGALLVAGGDPVMGMAGGWMLAVGTITAVAGWVLIKEFD